MKTTRRSFLQGMVVGAFAVAGGHWLDSCEPANPNPEAVREPIEASWDGGLINPEQANLFVRKLIEEPKILRGNSYVVFENVRLVDFAKRQPWTG